MDSSAFVADSELIDALKQRATTLHCEEDCCLFRQGERAEGLYLLHSGDVCLSMVGRNGKSEPIAKMPNGSLLGLPAVVGNGEYSLSAEAHQGAELSYVSREAFSKLMLEDPNLSMKILRVLAAELRTARIALSNA